MPRHSPFRIQLTRDERHELQAMARKYTSPCRGVIRAKLVLLAAERLSNDVPDGNLDTSATALATANPTAGGDDIVARVK